MAVKKGLGRGLNSLIPTGDAETPKETVSKSTKSTSTKATANKSTKSTSKSTGNESTAKPIIKEVIKKVEQTLNINKIEPNRDQPRKNFDEDALAELADSIKQYGVVEPLVVVKRKGYYELIAGERRWRAARLAGLKEVPVVIKDYTDQEVVEIALIENIQREDLNPIEEAHAYQRLIEEFSLTQEEVATKVSKSRSAITNALRLLKLTDDVQQMLIDGRLSAGHVRTLITIEDPALQYEAAMHIFDENLSVRETESYVKKLLSNKTKDKKENEKSEDLSFIYKDIEERLKTALGTKATIKAKNKNKGKIEIEYYSADDLDRITSLLFSSNE